MTYEDIIKRFDAAKANKQEWNSHLRECYRYFMPERNTIDKWNPGQKKREWVFDSTSQAALEDFATRMESELIPSNINWMKLEAGTDIPEEQEERASKYLDETTDIVFNHIRSSNFSSQAHESFLDLGISTGALIVEAGDGIQSSLNFRCVSLSELVLEQSQQGIVKTVYREFKLPVGDLPAIYPNAKMNDKLSQLLLEKPTTKIGLIEATVYDNNKRNYQNVVMYKEGKFFVINETLESSPWVVFRESTIPGEVYGRGRAMTALPDTKTLNLMKRDFLSGLRWWSTPTYTATDDGVINPYTAAPQPGGIIPVGSNANDNPTLRPLPSAGQPVLLMDAIKMQQNAIKQVMLAQPFGNIEDTPVRTATEMSIRNAELAKTSLGASARIQNELLETLIARSVYILKKAGKVADFKVDGKEVKIKFTSPSARMQDEQQLAALGRAMEMMMALPPEIVQEQIAIELIPGEIVDILGLPSKYKRSEEEKAERAKQHQAQQQQQQEMAAASVEAQQGGA